MKLTFDTLTNVLLAMASIVVIAVGATQLRAMLSERPSSANEATKDSESIAGLEIAIEDAAMTRKPEARVALVEFSDYQCPYCGKYARETFAQIRQEYVDSGKVAYLFLNFPLESIHPLAFKAAEAAECASEQGKYWEMHERLFANQNTLDENALAIHGQAVGLGMPEYTKCLLEGRTSKIRKQMADGQRLGVGSTPMFFLGRVEPAGRIRLIRKLRGAQPFPSFRLALNDLLTPKGVWPFRHQPTN